MSPIPPVGVVIIPQRALRAEVSREVAEQWAELTRPVPGLKEYFDAFNRAMAEKFERECLESLSTWKTKNQTPTRKEFRHPLA